MRINPITNNELYTQKQNINKNNRPSFGKITNMAEITARIEQDVKNRLVTREFADQTIEGLNKIKFSMLNGLESYHKGVYYSRFDKTNDVFNNIYLPALQDNELDADDLPFILNFAQKSCKCSLVKDFISNASEVKGFVFSLVKDFADIRYSSKNDGYVPLEEDPEKKLLGEFLPDIQCFTKSLHSLIKNEHLENTFYSLYSDKVIREMRDAYVHVKRAGIVY